MARRDPERRLVLVRHAKADYPEGVDDHDRPLTERGERDAVALGRLLHDTCWPDMVLCSTSVRTRRTWELAEGQADEPVTVRYEPSLYLASPRAVLGLVRGTSDDARCLVVVGHNPGTHELAVALAGRGDKEQLAALAEKLPTAGVVVLGVDGGWDDLAEGGARLEQVSAARG
ncbi:SixA phosphatase family protein [Vallicoccus soli]|uniref:Histidine phosphatase family protein n=1 Tax=Vallicoccus soli TaxID=2339232 RepID=A0A3A3YSY5_9ACTN|nr:histidine phosphatase family protein [Vallicoccus soli]RJK93788.1 histidine phosphatase family protein [Vallicoccus soli]